MQTAYEWTFELADLSEDLEDALGAVDLDVFCAVEVGIPTVTVTTEGDSAVAAGRKAVRTLRGAGATVVRSLEDLVTRSEIARRADKTPQAVGNWLRGDRQTGVEPPRTYVQAGVDLWLWSEVRGWLSALGVEVDSSINFPGRLDHWRINADLVPDELSGRGTNAAGWSFLAVGVDVTYNDIINAQLRVPIADNTAHEFGLAA